MIRNEKILQCVYNINTIVSNIQSITVELEEIDVKPDSLCHDDLTRYSYIKICTFLDEMDLLNSYSQDDEYVLDIMTSIKPLMQIVSKYKHGFKKVRNIMLAHLNRDNKGNFLPAWGQLKSIKLPKDTEEMNLIYGSLDVIRVILIDCYSVEFKEYHASIVNEIKNEINEFAYAHEIPIDFNEVLNEVERRLKDKGVLDGEIDFRKKFAPERI